MRFSISAKRVTNLLPLIQIGSNNRVGRRRPKAQKITNFKLSPERTFRKNIAGYNLRSCIFLQSNSSPFN